MSENKISIENELNPEDKTKYNIVNYGASTSKSFTNTSSEIDDKTASKKTSESSKIFNKLIEKCYENPYFPKSNIEAIDKLYRSLPPEYLDTKYFLKLLDEVNKIVWPDTRLHLYVHMDYVHKQLLQFQTLMEIQEREMLEKNNDANMKKNIKLSKLKKALKNVQKQIQYLETKEMDINDDDAFDLNSPYILKDRYERRMIQIYKKICKMTDEPTFFESKLCFQETNNKLVNKVVQKYYNTNPVFPDYYEIHTLLKILREKKKLNWTESELNNNSLDAFIKLGEQLKKKRCYELFSSLSHWTSETDPAENNLELKKKLDESYKKLCADLDAVTNNYCILQDIFKNTDGPFLDNSNCEISSDDNSNDNNQYLNKKSMNTNTIPIKRKQLLPIKSEKNEPPKKSQRIIDTESFNSTPCSVAFKPLNNLVNDKMNDNIEKILSEKTSDDLEKGTNNVSKIISENSNNTSPINSEKVTDEALNIATENKKNSVENLFSYDPAAQNYSYDTDGDNTLVIDENKQVDNDTNYSVSIDREDNISNLEVINHEGENLRGNVIKSIEHDDSDVEKAACKIRIVRVHNKKSLESIIIAKNLRLKYDQNQVQRPIQIVPTQKPSSSAPSHGSRNQNSDNQDQNTSNHNFYQPLD